MMHQVPTLAPFQELHPELFKLLAEAGWKPGETPDAASSAVWEQPDRWFNSNTPGIAFMVELSGICIHVGEGTNFPRFIRFGCTDTLTTMSRNYDFEADVYKIIGTYNDSGTPDGYPVAEGPGAVLFVRQDYYSAFIDHSLCGFFRAPDPFIILDWYLLGIHSPLLEHRGVHQGDRIARYL
jgi:hypothetical protein